MAAFCRARDLRIGQFYAWRRRLRDGGADGFVEVAVVGQCRAMNPIASRRLLKRVRPRAVRWARTRLPSEREMKRVVLNRKNSLFDGNPRGRTAAILSSLTSTCRRQAVDPPLYFTQLLTNLPVTSNDDLALWLPDQWKLRHGTTMAGARPTLILGFVERSPAI